MGALLLAACGDDSGEQAGDDTPDAAEGTQIKIPISYLSYPLLLGVRASNGDWTPLTPIPTADDNLVAYARVTGPYEVVMACGVPEYYETTILQVTPDDEISPLTCVIGYSDFDDPTGRFTLSGEVTQPGEVTSSYVSASGTTSPWSYALNVDPGLREVVAASATRFVIAPVTVEANTTVPLIDLATQGTDFEYTAVNAVGLAADETLYTTISAATDREYPSFTREGAMLPRFPASAVVNQGGSATAESPSALRRSRVALDATTADVTFLPRLDDVMFQPLGAGFTSLPAGVTRTSLVSISDDTSIRYLQVLPSAAYLAGATEITTSVDDIPGYLPAWKPTGTTAFQRFTVSDAEGRSSSVYDRPLGTLKYTRGGKRLERLDRTAGLLR